MDGTRDICRTVSTRSISDWVSAGSADSIEVTWPSGKKQVVQSPKINSQIEVREQ